MRGKTHEMFFRESMTFDEKDLSHAAVAAPVSRVYEYAESEFVERLKSGDADAFDNLITRYSADIYALLYRLTENAEEAADLSQETFLSALKSIKGFRGEADLKTWLFRIAINHSRNRFRWWKRRKREKTISLDAQLGESETTLGEMLPDSGTSPEQDVLRREREGQLRQALTDLSESYREVVILCDIECLSYEEIAQTLDINIGTVKSRIARGREELRRKLSDI